MGKEESEIRKSLYKEKSKVKEALESIIGEKILSYKVEEDADGNMHIHYFPYFEVKEVKIDFGLSQEVIEEKQDELKEELRNTLDNHTIGKETKSKELEKLKEDLRDEARDVARDVEKELDDDSNIEDKKEEVRNIARDIAKELEDISGVEIKVNEDALDYMFSKDDES